MRRLATAAGIPSLTRDVGVLTVDDHAVFRAAAHEVIDATPGFAVLGEAPGGEEAFVLMRELNPELVLVDVRMRGMDGIETTRRVRREHPGAVVVLISLDEPTDVSAIVESSGAATLVRKQDFCPLLLQKLWSVHGHRG